MGLIGLMGEAGYRVRICLASRITGLIRLCSHLEGELATLVYLIVCNVIASEGLAVQLAILNVVVLGTVVFGLYNELFAVFHRDGSLSEYG